MSQESLDADGETQPGRWSWLLDGVRSAVFLQPRWPHAEVAPWMLGSLVVVGLALGVLVQRLMIEGEVSFYWQAVAGGWFVSLISLWLCWLVARSPAKVGEPPRVSTLFAILAVLSMVVYLLATALSVLLVRFGPDPASHDSQWIYWAIFSGMLGWITLAGGWLLIRQAGKWSVRAAVVLCMLVNAAFSVWTPRAAFWYPDDRGEESAEPEPSFELTQELMEAQSATLVRALDAIGPQRPGKVDLYAITFAPYAAEDVFSREAGMVSEVMRERFDAGGRQIQLQNHNTTVGTMPWATPLNLQRAIERAAQRMDLSEDVLFLHLTSHGARDGLLSAGFSPVKVDEVTPQQLKTWLTQAGVRYSVISISACYSGSWIAPLSGPGTLVMTAADADHTSYGCGRKSSLTFFGRAVFDEQLRRSTRSFEAAHAAARKMIAEREKEAGKTDGYSNPQIAVGAEIRARLAQLEARLAALP